MAKNISSGIGRDMTHGQVNIKQIEQMSKSWKDLRNRLDIILMTNNVMKTNELRQKCLAMDGMSITERRAHILEHWGPLYLEKAQPLLQQLEILEQNIDKQQKSII